MRRPATLENTEPQWFTELKQLISPDWVTLLETPGGATVLGKQLPETLAADRVILENTNEKRIWDLVGYYYRLNEQWYDAKEIYSSMYDHFLRYQISTGIRVHKGLPLVWIADCYANVANIPMSKRYLMLTLIEDAISENGILDTLNMGSYYRLAWRHGLPDIEIRRYAQESSNIFQRERKRACFPEYVLQDLDKDWLVEVPSVNDAGIYVANITYIQQLIAATEEKSGKALENLADYLLSCIPGCRTTRRKRSYSTDYDVVCSLYGPDVDFRSDFGRYFICECKDWKKPAGFSELAKFARVLDSIKARFGIIFSKKGISGNKRTTDARREQIKVFQDRGLIIVVVNLEDLEYVAKGGNFVSLLRNKYEQIRLDLPQT